ncbi:MAG: glycosyltransferase, partial [Bacteroidota bacterium]
ASVSAPHKGLKDLIAAVRIINDPKIHVSIVGDDPKNFLANVRIPHKHIPLKSRSEELIPYYDQADVLVTPSKEDNLPNVIAEAMSCGTPVISYATGGIPEMVLDGKNGILTKTKSPLALSEAIYLLKQDEKSRDKFSTEARKHIVNNFGYKPIAHQMKQLYSTSMGMS